MSGGEAAAATSGADAPLPAFDSAEAVKLWLSERFARESDPERILRIAAAAVGEFLGAARVGYGEFEADATRIAIPLDWARGDLPSIAGVHSFDPTSEIGQRCAKGQAVVIDDIADSPRIRDRAGPLAAGTSRAFIVIPLINDGGLVAVFVATDDTPRHWSEADVTLVSQTGARIWSALQHLRLTAQLRESEEQFRMMAENLPGICWVGDRDAKPMWGNTRWHAMYDDTAAALGDARGAIHPDDLPRARQIWQEMRENGTPGEFQLRLRGRDGIFRPFLSKAAPIRDATGAVTRWVGVQVDLSDQQAQDRRQAVLRAVHDQTRDLTDPYDVLRALGGILTTALGTSRFLYYEPGRSTAERHELVRASLGDDAALIDLTLADATFAAIAGRASWDRSRVVDDNQVPGDEPTEATREIAERLGVRSGINAPIMRDGALVALLCVVDTAPRRWSAEDVALVEELGERLWTSLARVRAEHGLQERERAQAFLIGWTDRIRDLRSPAAIVATTLELLAAQFGVVRATYSVSQDPLHREFTIAGEWHAPSVASIAHTRFSLDYAGAALEREWLGGEILRYDDVAGDERIAATMRSIYAGADIRAFLTIPLIEQGFAQTALSVQHDAPRHWTDAEVQLLREVAERTWLAIERARAEGDLHERERSQAFLIDWSDRIRGLASTDAITAATLAALGDYLGVARATYAIADDAGETFTICGEWRDHGPSIVGEVFTFAATGPVLTQDWRSGEIIRSADIETDPAIAPEMLDPYRQSGIRAFVSVPLLEAGRVRSSLSVQHDAPRDWSQRELTLLREVAERTWVALERARAEAELKERERGQAFLIEWTDRTRELSTDTAIIDETMAMLAAHLGVARATYSVADTGGRRFDIRGEWHAPRVVGIAGTSFSLDDVGETVEREWVSGAIVRYADIAADARIEDAVRDAYLGAQIQAFVSVPLIENGRVRSALSVQHDAPRAWTTSELSLLRDVADRAWVAIERAWAEAELQERERSQAFLIDWTDRLRGERAPDRIVAITLARLGEHFGVNRTTYSLGDETGNLLTNRGEWADGVISVADQVWRLDDVDPEVRRQWLAGEPVHYDDIPTDPRVTPARRAFFESVSVRSLVTIPLIEDGRVRSALSLQSKVERCWTEGEIQLLCDVAERTWVVLERARAEAELETRERNQAFLIDWSDRIRGEGSPAAIIAATVAAIGRFLGVSRATFATLDGEQFEVTAEWRDGVKSLLGNRFTLPSVGAAVDRDWHAGEHIAFADVAADPRLEAPARDRYLGNDIRAFLSVPLVAGGTMQSALSVQSAAPRAWTEAEVQLLRDVAERTWGALERAEAQAAVAERARHQAFLVAWNDIVRGEGSARVILARTVRMLADHLAAARVNYAEPSADFSAMTVIEEHTVRNIVSVTGTTYRLADFGERLAAAQLSGQPVRIDDIATDPLLDEATRPLFEGINVRAALTLPMLRGGEIMAVLSVQHDTARRWTDAEVELVRDVADRTLAVLERAQSEARLAESEAQLSAFLENAPVAMSLRDAKGRYIRLNPEFGRSVRRPVETLTGLTPAEIFAPQIAAQVGEMHARAMAGEVVSAEMSDGSDETYSSVLTIAFPIGDRQGSAKTAGFTIDLTERKRAEAALQTSRDALYQTEKLTALGSLLAGVSHELNNPLSIVVAQAVMMERQSQGTQLAERAQKIRKAADRCARIVQSFLAMARQKRPEREAVDLNAIATAAHELADYGLKNDGIHTVRALAPNLPPISADSDQLHQIVINLIVNAQQSMVEAGVADRTLTLRSGLGEQPGTVFLEVADNGPGVPVEVQRRIFEPFYTTKPQGQGTGVGLSFSQGVAEAHGGTLALVPAKTGACFRLTLPVDAAQALVAAAPELALVPPAPARRALVVDDEREIAESLADFLSLEGFTCEIAAGGRDAQARLTDGEYDLIVSDLRMPDCDGPQLHAWVAEHRPDQAARMAFATGDTLGQTAARFLAEFQRPVLEKPFTPEAVRRFLEQMDLA